MSYDFSPQMSEHVRAEQTEALTADLQCVHVDSSERGSFVLFMMVLLTTFTSCSL